MHRKNGLILWVQIASIPGGKEYAVNSVFITAKLKNKQLRHSDAYWCTRAQTTAACGDYAAATDCLREALKYTNFAQVHHQMYLYCRQTGDTAGAIHALQQETGVTPGRLAPRYMLWQYYVSLQDTIHARQTAREIIQTTHASDEALARHYRQIMQEYLDKSGKESIER